MQLQLQQKQQLEQAPVNPSNVAYEEVQMHATLPLINEAILIGFMNETHIRTSPDE